MGYIRDDEDYYRSCGMSTESARFQVMLDKEMRGVDAGFCNPRKAKEYDEALENAKKKLKGK